MGAPESFQAIQPHNLFCLIPANTRCERNRQEAEGEVLVTWVRDCGGLKQGIGKTNQFKKH